MKQRITPLELAVLALFFVFTARLFLMAPETKRVGNISESRLTNGLKVILFENHKAPVITFQVWYRAGSRNDPWGKSGLSHVLEHMMFKGTQQISAEEFIETIQQNGGNYNAFTSYDFAGYFETLEADRVEIPLRLESDRMRNLVMREEDFQTEKMVVMEERRLRTEDNPKAYLLEEMQAAAFQAQPYHWPVIGWMGDLERISLEDTREYYRIHYNPANSFIVAVGDFQKDELLVKIEEAFGSIPPSPAPQHYSYIDPPQEGERRVHVKKEAQLPFIVMGYHVPNLLEPDSYVLEVIAAILSGGKSSRFYERLVREKQLALSANAEHSLLSQDPGLFSVSAEPLPGRDVAELEQALNEEVQRLQSEPVGENELQKAKNQLEADFLFTQDSFFYQAMLLARYEIVDDWTHIKNYIPMIRKVSAEDIRLVANRYLVPQNRTVGILIPLAGEVQKPVPPESPVKPEPDA